MPAVSRAPRCGWQSKYTKSALFGKIGKKTPVLTRFSTVTFGREFPDSGRNPRGFAIKFYTEGLNIPRLFPDRYFAEGNYDLVGLNFPVFFIRDGALGPDVIRSQQRRDDNFLLNIDAMFDFMCAAARCALALSSALTRCLQQVAGAREFALRADVLQRSRHAARLPPHGRLRLPHFQMVRP